MQNVVFGGGPALVLREYGYKKERCIVQVKQAELPYFGVHWESLVIKSLKRKRFKLHSPEPTKGHESPLGSRESK